MRGVFVGLGEGVRWGGGGVGALCHPHFDHLPSLLLLLLHLVLWLLLLPVQHKPSVVAAAAADARIPCSLDPEAVSLGSRCRNQVQGPSGE